MQGRLICQTSVCDLQRTLIAVQSAPVIRKLVILVLDGGPPGRGVGGASSEFQKGQSHQCVSWGRGPALCKPRPPPPGHIASDFLKAFVGAALDFLVNLILQMGRANSPCCQGRCFMVWPH